MAELQDILSDGAILGITLNGGYVPVGGDDVVTVATAGTGVTVHEALTGLQGGKVDDRHHITEAQALHISQNIVDENGVVQENAVPTLPTLPETLVEVGQGSLLLARDGKMFSGGRGRGAGDGVDFALQPISPLNNLTEVTHPEASPIIQIWNVGSALAATVHANGAMYYCGYNDNGQSGSGHTNDITTYTLVKSNVKRILNNKGREKGGGYSRLGPSWVELLDGSLEEFGQEIISNGGGVANNLTFRSIDINRGGYNFSEDICFGAYLSGGLMVREDPSSVDSGLGTTPTQDDKIWTKFLNWGRGFYRQGAQTYIDSVALASGGGWYNTVLPNQRITQIETNQPQNSDINGPETRTCTIALIREQVGEGVEYSRVEVGGWNDVGQHGLGHTNQADLLTVVPGLLGITEEVHNIGLANENVLLALQTNGDLYAWGYNLGGDHFLNGATTITSPTLILSNVKEIMRDSGNACRQFGEFSPIVIKDNANDVWICSKGVAKGTGNIARTSIFEKIIFPEGEEAVEVHQGYYPGIVEPIHYMIAKMVSNQIFAWGMNKEGFIDNTLDFNVEIITPIKLTAPV